MVEDGTYDDYNYNDTEVTYDINDDTKEGWKEGR